MAVSSSPSTFDRSGRGIAVLCAVSMVVSLLHLAAAAPATAEEDPPPALGGQLYSTGGAVTIEVLSASAGLTSQLFLLDPEEVSIASNREVGRQVTVGPYPTGTELIFGIRVQGQEYRLGPANRNPDGIEHAVVDFGPDGCAVVGFEDLYGGGDRDYDDNRFKFCGGIAPDPEDPEEPPAPDPVRPPLADAGADQSVPEGSVVTLDGSASHASTKPSLQPSERRGTLPGGTSMGVELVELDPDATTPTATGKVEIGQGPQAQNTSIAYVLDVSGSTTTAANCGGDANGDGSANRVLDCEVAAAMKLHEKVVQAGTVDKVAVIQFSSSASARDLDPTSGTATLISPTADKDNDGILDVIEGLRALRSGGGTNFVPPASVACSLLATTNSPNLVAAFLSDGQGGGNLSSVVPCNPPVVFKAFAAGSGSSCNAGSAGSRLNDLAFLSGGTCLNVPNVENLPDILPEVISSTVTKVEYTLDAGAPVDISPALGLPLAGPGEAGFAIELPADLAGSHRLCVTVSGRDAGGVSSETTCSDLVTVTGELTYDWRQVESVGPPIFLSSRTTAHPSFVAPDDGTYVFELTVSDGTGGTATDRVTVEVTNVDPVLEIDPGAAYAGGVTQITGTLTDEGWQDSHTVRFDWGDGTVDEVEVTTRGAGWGSFFGSHVYRHAGTYQAAVTLLDDDGGRDVADLSGFEVETPVALWANSTSLTRSLDWSGGEGDIRGRVHTNGQLRFIGARKSVVGPTTYAGRLSADTTRYSFLPAPAAAPVQDFPFKPDIAAFRPGGAVALEIGPAYHDMSSRCAAGSWHDVQTVLESGVYYASCDIQLNGSDIGGRVTLVSEGHVKIAGSRPAFEPYADGLLVVAGATGPAAIDISTSASKFLGVLFAEKGEISIAGADNRFFCGILGDQVRITGTDVDIRGAACGRPDATVADPVVVPDLTAELTVDRSDALPSDTLGYSVDVSNEGTTLVVPALVGLENVDAATATVTGYSFALERQDTATGEWSPLAAKNDPALRIELRHNPYAGVTYPSDGGVAGTSLPPGGWATWGLQAVLSLSPAESAILFDADQTSGLRTRVDFDLDPSSVQARRLYTIGDDFLGVLRDLTPDVTAASATLVLPSGEAEVREAEDDPALAAIAPGETATLTDAWDVPVPAARSATETDAGYLSRLLAQDGTRLNAASFVIATGGVGRLVAPLSIVTTKRHLPVVGISTTGPEGLQSGSSGDYAFDLANLGSSSASDLVTTAAAGDDALTVSGAPGALEPGESARATASYTAPPGQSGPIGLRSEVTWTDARGNEYGENGSTLQVLRQTPGQLGASLTDALQVDADGNGSVGPGDTVRYTLTVRNSGGAPLTDVAATVPVDEHTTLVPGSGQTPDGGTLTLDGNQVEVSLPNVAGGGSRRVLFDVKVADPFPNGVVRIQAQGTVQSPGQSEVLTDDPALPGASDPTRTTITVPRPALAAFLAGHLVIDADGTGTVTPGDTLAYELQVNSVGTQAVDEVVAEVPTPAGTTLVAGSVTASRGTIDDGGVDVALGTLAPFQEATIRFRLRVDKPLPAGITTVSARAEVRSAQLPVQYSDDATTVEVGDPTVIPVGEPGTVDPEEQGPVVSEVLPAEGTTVTEPVHITAQLAAPDGATLDSWVVDYRLAGDTTATVIGSGTGGDVDAVLDPTVMPNGTYVVSVRGTTAGGGLTTRDITVVVEGDLKLGRYQTTVTDMSVGVAGLPIQVNRSYDSFDKATGDFGVGWTVDLANFKVSSNGRLGEGGWTMQTCGGGLIYVPLCFTSDRPHFVTVTWPDGRNEYFDMTPAKTWSFIPGMTTAEFTARSGSTSTLKAVDPSLFLFGDNLEGGFFGSDGVYDPRQFVLTDRFGTKYTLEVGVGLKRVEDPTGAVTTFSRNGITSSRGPGVDFVRDDQGRITKVTGPDGRTVLYGYDAAGDLASVTDQAGKVTSLSYLPGHYLDQVTGPGGATMARFEYTDGRLTAVLDGEGNRTEISSSVGARQETVTDPGGRRTTIKSYDDDGLLVSVNEVYGGAAHITEYEYDADRNVTLRRDPAGHEWRSTYDDGNITSVTLPSGARTEMTYNNLGQLLTWTDAEGATTTYTWNANGTLASVTDPLGNAETYTYNASGMRTGKTDRNGKVWAWTYTAGGLVSTETDPLGGVTRFEYDASGRQTAAVDPAGNRTETAYDASGNAIRVTDADGAVSRTEFDDLNRVLRDIDPMGHAVDYTYDDAGRTTRVDNHVDAATAYAYDALGRQTSVTVGNRPAVTTTYDGAGHVLTRTDQIGRTTTSTYYPDGSLHTVTNPAGGVTTYTYTPDGKVASVEDAAGGVTRYSYTETGRVHTVTDPLDAVTTHEYDDAGRLTATVAADGSRTERTYDDAGHLISSTDQNGETTTFEYDALGRRVAEVDPEGRRTETSYGPAGRPTKVTAPDGGETVSVFSPGGRLLSSTTPEGVRTSYGYNANGLLTSTTDELGHTWSTTYDPLGRVLTERDPRQQGGGSPTMTNAYNPYGELASTTDVAGNRVTFGYDAAGQRTTVTDPRGKAWSVEYGALGGVVTETDPLGRERTTEFDDSGRATRTVDQRDVAVGYDYDAAGRLVTIDDEDGSGDIAFGYDVLGRRTSMTDPTGTTGWTYLPNGAVSSIEAPAGTVDYTYDGSGRRLTMAQPAGTVEYSYDSAGRLAEVTDWDGRTFGTTFDRDGRVATLARPNGVRSEWSYDDAGRLTGVRSLRNGNLVERSTYTLDADGNRTSMTSSAGVETYTINALDQITAVTYPHGSTTTYTYDAAGNRLTSKKGADPVVAYTYDDASQLTSVGGSTVTHDAAGNVTGAQGTTYDWDWLHRLVRVDDGGQTSTFGYDGDGVRTSRTVHGVTEELLYDRASDWGLPALIADGDQSFLHLLGGVIEEDGSTTRYPLADGLGSIRTVTDASGATIGTASYDVFGAVRSRTGTESAFGFTGAPQAGDLVHLNARDLSTSLGAFLSTDAVRPGSPGVVGWNPYSYVANNPTTWTDPSGQTALVGYIGTTSAVASLYAIAALGLTLAIFVFLYLQQVIQQVCGTGGCVLDPPWGGNNGNNGGGSGGGTTAEQLTERFLQGARAAGEVTREVAAAMARACLASAIASYFPGVSSPCSTGVPIFFVGLDTPETLANTVSGLSQHPEWLRLSRKSPPHSRSWLRRDSRCTGSNLNNFCDEYPYASTQEGGGPWVALKVVPAWEQRIQAGQLSSFYGDPDCGIGQTNGVPFAVIPGAPLTGHYCN